MRLMLGSGGFRTPERVGALAEQMKSFFGDRRTLLFIPYALHDHERYVQELCARGVNAGYELDGIHRHPDPMAAVERAEALFIGGGNTFRLLHALYKFDLLDVIRERVRQGLPYLGVSAGTNVACPTIMTTNDMPIVRPPSFAALALVPCQVNPHYYSGQNFVKEGEDYVPHFGETRDERIREFHEMNDTPVVGLWEAGILRIEGEEMQLVGAAARVFRKGQEPADVPAGTRLDELLSSKT
jgi:dipeptidase E